MGSGRIARDGGSADALAGNPQRNLAERLFDRVSPGGNGRTISPARVGMASDVLDRRAARATRAVYPDESAGIGSVEAAPRCEHGQVLRIVAGEWKRFVYLVVLMTFMMVLSHA